MKNLYALCDELSKGDEKAVEMIRRDSSFITHCYKMFDAYTTMIGTLEMIGITRADMQIVESRFEESFKRRGNKEIN